MKLYRFEVLFIILNKTFSDLHALNCFRFAGHVVYLNACFRAKTCMYINKVYEFFVNPRRAWPVQKLALTKLLVKWLLAKPGQRRLSEFLRVWTRKFVMFRQKLPWIYATSLRRLFTNRFFSILSMDITMLDSLPVDKLQRLTQNLIKVFVSRLIILHVYIYSSVIHAQSLWNSWKFHSGNCYDDIQGV